MPDARSRVRLAERQLFGRQIVNGDKVGNHPGFLRHTRRWPGLVKYGAKIQYFEFEGLGVSRCATCDGRILRGKSVAVIVNISQIEIGNSSGLNDRAWTGGGKQFSIAIDESLELENLKRA